MSRIEKIEESQKSTLQTPVRDEVVEPFGDHKKKTRKRFSCLGIFFIALVLLVGFFAWEIAATGLVTVPVFSSVAFSEPIPVRVVKAGVMVEQLSESEFKKILMQRLRAGGGTLSDRSITLGLPESSLTATLQNILKQYPNTNIDASRAQIAVLPNQELELFVPLQVAGRKTVIIAHVLLVADKGLFDLKLLNVRLGSFKAPSMLVAALVQPFVNQQLVSLNHALSSYMHVDSLVTEEGVLTASGTFTVEVKK